MLELRNVLDIWEYCDKLRSKNCEKTIFNPLTFREKFIFALPFSGKLNPYGGEHFMFHTETRVKTLSYTDIGVNTLCYI
jgi:hypothetical protein